MFVAHVRLLCTHSLHRLVFRPQLHAVHRCGLLLHVSHVAWSVCLCVCVLDTRVYFAKMAEPIKMPFGG